MVAYYRPQWAPAIDLPFSCRCLTTQLHVAEKFCGIDTRSEESPLRQHGFQERHFALEDSLRQAWIYLTLKSLLREHKLEHACLKDHEEQQQKWQDWQDQAQIAEYEDRVVRHNTLNLNTSYIIMS